MVGTYGVEQSDTKQELRNGIVHERRQGDFTLGMEQQSLQELTELESLKERRSS